MKTLATRLAWARTRKAMTQEQLADVLDLSQGTIGNLEAGTRKTSRSIAAVAAALDVDALWLETGVGDPDAIESRTLANFSDLGLLVTLFGRLDAPDQCKVMELVKTLAAGGH